MHRYITACNSAKKKKKTNNKTTQTDNLGHNLKTGNERHTCIYRAFSTFALHL